MLQLRSLRCWAGTERPCSAASAVPTAGRAQKGPAQQHRRYLLILLVTDRFSIPKKNHFCTMHDSDRLVQALRFRLKMLLERKRAFTLQHATLLGEKGTERGALNLGVYKTEDGTVIFCQQNTRLVISVRKGLQLTAMCGYVEWWMDLGAKCGQEHICFVILLRKNPPCTWLESLQ